MATSKPIATATDAPAKDTPATKPPPLEEDDEFEDFPAEDWSDTETDGNNGKIKHLWEDGWDDDETSDEFAAQLREELKKVHAKDESMS